MHSIELIEKVFQEHFAGKETFFKGSWWIAYDKEDFIRFAVDLLKQRGEYGEESMGGRLF